MPDHVEEYKVINVKLDRLKPHPRNEAIYGHEPVDMALCESISEIGIDTPLEITKDYTLIKGHRRLQCAKYLKLETVPCRIRMDLEDEHSILFTLIEDNRHQRERNPLQKQREVKSLMDIIAARRKLTGDLNIRQEAKLTGIDLTQASEMAPEAARKLDEAIEDAKSKIKSERQKGSTYHLALQIGGQENKQYAKARKVNEAIDKLRSEGKEIEAGALQEQAIKNLSSAERGARVLLGEGSSIKPRRKPRKKAVRSVSIGSQCDNCTSALKSLRSLLSDDHDQRVGMALKIVETIKNLHSKAPDATDSN